MRIHCSKHGIFLSTTVIQSYVYLSFSPYTIDYFSVQRSYTYIMSLFLGLWFLVPPEMVQLYLLRSQSCYLGLLWSYLYLSLFPLVHNYMVCVCVICVHISMCAYIRNCVRHRYGNINRYQKLQTKSLETISSSGWCYFSSIEDLHWLCGCPGALANVVLSSNREWNDLPPRCPHLSPISNSQFVVPLL